MSKLTTFVRADRLRLATLFQSKEATRYYLQGVHIAAMHGCGVPGLRIAATDGVSMGVFHDDEGFTSADCIVALPKEAIAAMKRARECDGAWFGLFGEHRGRTEARVLVDRRNGISADDARREIATGGARVEWQGFVELIEGVFPQVWRVVPSSAPGAAPPSTYDGAHLARFGVVAGDCREKTPGVLLFGGADQKSPALVDCGRPDFVGVLMPIARPAGLQCDRGQVSPPAWATQPALGER